MEHSNSYTHNVTVSRVTIDGDEYVGIVKAKKGDPEDNIIAPEDVGTLWLTLKAASKAMGLPVANVWLKGTETTDDGKFWEILEGDVTYEAKNGKTYTRAYSAKQIAAFEPKHLHLAWGRFHGPQLNAGLAETRNPGGTRAAVKRVDRSFAPVTAQKPGKSASVSVKRAKA